MSKRSSSPAGAPAASSSLLIIDAPSPAPAPAPVPAAQPAAPPSPSPGDDELAKLEQEALADVAAAAAAPGAPGAPGAAGEVVEPDLPTSEVLEMLYAPIAMLAAPNWALTPTEIKTLAEAHARVFDKYFPDFTQHLGAEIVATLVTITVFTPRIAGGKPPRLPKKPLAPGDGSTEVKSQPAA